MQHRICIVAAWVQWLFPGHKWVQSGHRSDACAPCLIMQAINIVDGQEWFSQRSCCRGSCSNLASIGCVCACPQHTWFNPIAFWCSSAPGFCGACVPYPCRPATITACSPPSQGRAVCVAQQGSHGCHRDMPDSCHRSTDAAPSGWPPRHWYCTTTTTIK
jgi:hypothetical protein